MLDILNFSVISNDLIDVLITVVILGTLISSARYLLGLKSYGIYIPLILSVAYAYSGIRYGLVITAIVILGSIVSHKLISQYRMHYISKISITYILTSIMLIFGILILGNLPFLNLDRFAYVPTLSIIAILSLTDFFIKTYIKKSLKQAIRVSIETVAISVLGWYLLTSQPLTTTLAQNLWLIPLLIILNILIGIFPGLRIKEVIRFWSVLTKHD